MERPLATQVRRLRRRIGLATLLRCSAEACLYVAMVAVAVVGVARLFDLVLRPDWSWLVLLVLAIGFAIWQLRRRQLTAASSTVWLDHHLGLGGLAMAELETDASAWRGELQERLRVAEPSRPLPRLRQVPSSSGCSALRR
jgi:hypothetical protein